MSLIRRNDDLGGTTYLCAFARPCVRCDKQLLTAEFANKRRKVRRENFLPILRLWIYALSAFSAQSLRSLRLTSLAPRIRRIHRIRRASPSRRVTRSRSRYSSNGIAYFRVTPVRSLKRPTSIFGERCFSAARLLRSSSSAD